MAFMLLFGGRTSRTALFFSFFMNYKSLDIQKIRCAVRSCPEGLAVADLIVRSGAEPLRVYPILFELEQLGCAEVGEAKENHRVNRSSG